MQSTTKKRILFAITCIILTQLLVSNFIGGGFSSNNSVEQLSSDDFDDFSNFTSENNKNNLVPEASEMISSWWNVSYSYRKRININNPLSFITTKPIEVYIQFNELDTVHENSIRIVKYDNEQWTPIPCQVWNQTEGGVPGTIDSTSISFIAEDLSPGSNTFYAYYDDDSQTYDQTDYSTNYLTSTPDGNNFTVDWNDLYGNNYSLSLGKDVGAFELLGNHHNFHQENSTSPGASAFDESLVGYWPFDGSLNEETKTYIDGPEEDNYVIFGSGISYDEGYFGEALQLSGNTYIKVNSNQNGYGCASPDWDEGVTLMSWIYVNEGVTGERIITSWDRSEYFRFAIDATNRRVFWATQSNGINDMYGTSGAFEKGVWTHVAVTYNPSTLNKRIYVNGELDASITAHSGNRIGASRSISRVGYFGTGSEDSTFDTTSRNGPQSYWNGLLDEYRAYNRPLDGDEIKDAMTKQGIQSPINNIEEIENGNVFVKYDVTWNLVNYTETTSMNVTDTWTFYRGLNYWNVQRTYWWDFSTQDLENIGLWNTLYSWDSLDLDPSTQDYYYYDGNVVAGHEGGFTIEDYAVLHDFDGDKHNFTALGLFMTDKQISKESDMYLGDIKSKAAIQESDESVNFVIGDSISIYNWNNLGPQESYDWSELNLTISFWPFIRQYYQVGASVALAEFEDLYSTLDTEMTIELYDEESVFYNLNIEVLDIDGLPVPDVNVSLYKGAILQRNLSSDEFGVVSFSDIEEDSFMANLTYETLGDLLYLGEFNIEVSSSALETNIISYTLDVNLTSAVIQFLAKGSGNPCANAEIGFKVWDGDSGEWSYLGYVSTDSTNGNITVRYINGSETTGLIDFNVSQFLGSAREINVVDAIPYESNWTVEFSERSYHTMYVQIENFETVISTIDYTSSYVYGESNLDFVVNYTVTENDVSQPITGAKIDISIRRGSTLIHQEDDVGTYNNGVYEVNISYDSLSLETQVSYNIEFSASKPSFNPKSSVESIILQDIETEMDIASESGFIIDTIYWGENFTVSLEYKESISNDLISSGVATYQVSEISAINGMLTPMGNGIYEKEFNSTSFGTTGIYTFFIIVDEQNYALQEDFSHRVVIQNRTTSLTPDQTSIDAFWKDNITINAFYEDTLIDFGLTDNTVVQWEVVGSTTLYGDMQQNSVLGEGWYSVELNTSIFSFAGFYNIRIYASAPNYVEKIQTITLNVQEIYTQLNGEITPTERVEMFFTDSQNFTFEYTSRVGGELSTNFVTVSDAQYVTFEWRNEARTLSGAGELIWDAENENYILDFNTSTRAIGTYIITVRIQERNYIARVAILTLQIQPREFEIGFGENVLFNPNTNILRYEVNQDDTVTIQFTLKETLYNSDKEDATIIWTYGGVSKEFTYLGDGVYQTTIVADKEAFFQQQLMEGEITIVSDNFNNVTITTQITVLMPELFSGVPTFYFVLGVAAFSLIVGALGVNQIIQNARIPAFIKVIDKNIKIIDGNKDMAAGNETESFNDLIINEFGEYWNALDLNIKNSLGISEAKDNLAPGDNSNEGGL